LGFGDGRFEAGGFRFGEVEAVRVVGLAFGGRLMVLGRRFEATCVLIDPLLP